MDGVNRQELEGRHRFQRRFKTRPNFRELKRCDQCGHKVSVYLSRSKVGPLCRACDFDPPFAKV